MSHHGTPYSISKALRSFLDDSLVHHSFSRRVNHLSSLSTAPAASTFEQRRYFHDYFVTHLPSSSLSPDKQHGPSHHKLPRADSQPHKLAGGRAASTIQASVRETTIVRIPINSAKHHYGEQISRGQRPYQEDTHQAGTIAIPAFAQRKPISLSRRSPNPSQVEGGQPGVVAEGGDPQVFYFGVFDGHGGSECSEFLRERLHAYIEEAALLFGLESSLQSPSTTEAKELDSEGGIMGAQDAEDLQRDLVTSWKETVGGYFRRFRPEFFPVVQPTNTDDAPATVNNSSIETVLSYAFLKADLDFTTAQAAKQSQEKAAESLATSQASSLDDPVLSDQPLNADDMLFHPTMPASQNLRHGQPKGSSPDLNLPIGGKKRFQGGSTASIAMISTPTPTPFWHPATPSTLIVAHVGDTRVLLCRTSDGKAVPLTVNHHPSNPIEANRLRRYAASFVTDSFGEERVLGLANTRAFGDIASKRIGVSAEPHIKTTQINPAEYSFLVLVSDGVCGHVEDQEIVDVVKEARTPAEAAQRLISYAVEVSMEGDNATAEVVRLGGWERRGEGGGGSLGTKEARDWKREAANNPRARRQ
ncbi:MgPP2C2, protein phosphatase 2C protein 2 [Polychaeton citri CBS 116435]|uniref:MgPP2C2, protein phosphatase 2C protein 2 n=1 Tax=Polychaeton citri CBS 116435 TaxID=1314669 RepID=A0A9P4Q5J0_9PEZI|nr:MgPP2C2, protein phosphatase 2C protein 2 [Polychaeton citri CBS 116435]